MLKRAFILSILMLALFSMPAISGDIPTVAHTIAATTTSARNATAFQKPDGRLFINSDYEFWYKLGDSTVVAATSDHHVPAGIPIIIGRGMASHLAVIMASGSGNVYVTELK